LRRPSLLVLLVNFGCGGPQPPEPTDRGSCVVLPGHRAAIRCGGMSGQTHNSIPNSSCNLAYCRFDAHPPPSTVADFVAMRAAAAARWRAHDPAAGRMPLNRLSASTSSCSPIWPTPGSLSRLCGAVAPSFGRTGLYATPPPLTQPNGRRPSPAASPSQRLLPCDTCEFLIGQADRNQGIGRSNSENFSLSIGSLQESEI